MVLLSLISALAQVPQPVVWSEAEDCAVFCTIKEDQGGSPMASGGKIAAPYWGQSLGDNIGWSFDLTMEEPQAWLAVRYAFGQRQFAGGENSRRRLLISVDRTYSEWLKVPDTGSWSIFKVAWLKLPMLSAGHHRLTLMCDQSETNTDIDCVGIYRTKRESAPFLPSVRAVSTDGKFRLCASPNADPHRSDSILRDFEKIVSTMKDYGGWSPHFPVNINVVEDALWPAQSVSAYSNDGGCFFQAGKMASDQGNWCHEMTHMMFQGRIPKWLDESLVRVITDSVWIPRLYGDTLQSNERDAAVNRAAESLAKSQTESTDNLAVLLRMLANRYGPELYGRFFRECTSAGKAQPGVALSKSEFAALLSKAAGEEVLPSLRRWTGWSSVPDGKDRT